ncbi:MAG: GTP pyrophosphokinase family protein [Thermoleophilia bacterium]
MEKGISVSAWSDTYQQQHSNYLRLASEVEFALNATTQSKGIKTHLITSRVKSFESLTRKAKQKELTDPMTELVDLVGIRVVVLFLSDLPVLDSLIRESFAIHSAEDKVATKDPASFGYMSVHYIASLGDRHQGPRYDGLKDQLFEIQTRTIVMDAWANVSHYLDYKGSTSVPEDLRRDFYALSGLFYVADQHFEILADRAKSSQDEARREVKADPREDVEVNLDTVEAFLKERYPDRSHADRQSIGELVDELVQTGYHDLAAIANGIDAGEPGLLKYEATLGKDKRPGRANVPFYDLGAARISLAIVDRTFSEVAYRDEPAFIRKYRLWDRPSPKT